MLDSPIILFWLDSPTSSDKKFRPSEQLVGFMYCQLLYTIMGCYWLSNVQVNLPLPSSDPILSAAGVETDDVEDGSPKLS